jgi:hypothetical protein
VVEISGGTTVTIAMSDAQIAQILRENSGGVGLTARLVDLSDLETLRSSVQPLWDDVRYSHSLLKALLVLAAFPTHGAELALKDVAGQFDWSRSATHRYVATWTALGVLERNPESRRYRRLLRSTDAAIADDA